MPLKFVLLLCLWIFYFFAWHSSSGTGKAAFAFELNADPVLWNHLSYRSKIIFGKVTTDVQLMAVPAEEVADLLITDSAGNALQASGTTIFYLTVDSQIQPLIGSPEKVQTQSWVNPKNAAALQRIRLRKGRKIWQKSYRFHPNGVYHLRKKPIDKKQLELPPEQWTTVEKKFYQYNRKNLECPAVIEPSGLLYLVSGMDLRKGCPPISLCVFDKQQLHRVALIAGGEQQLKVNYLERSPGKQIRREGAVDVIKISFQPRSIASPNIAPEAFSFLGLKGDFDIYIDQVSRIPVQVSGKIPTFGQVDIRLHEVNLVP